MWSEFGLSTQPFPDRSHPDLSHPRSFGDYELCEAIARGGMGVVYRARHVPLDRVVAIKMIRVDRLAGDVDHQRFHNEPLTVARLDHPHIVPILDVGEAAEIHYFTMKLMGGGDLQEQVGSYLDRPRDAAVLSTVREITVVAGASSRSCPLLVLRQDAPVTLRR